MQFFRMLKFLTLSLAMVAMASSAIVPRQLSCEECIKEMHSIDMFVKLGAEAIEVQENTHETISNI